MALNPAVKALLDSAGLESNLEDVPVHFAEAEQLVDSGSSFSTFDTEELVSAAGEAPSSKTDSENYLHIRQYLLKEVRAAEREKVVSERIAKIQATVKQGNKDEILSLFKQRHLWRQRADEFTTPSDKLCTVEGCIRVSLPGSEFCIGHIMRDPNQKLFVECPTCHRPHPVMTTCFACRGS